MTTLISKSGTTLSAIDFASVSPVVQSAGARVTADQSTTSTAAYVDLPQATVTITTLASTKVLVMASFSVANANITPQAVFVSLAIDGALDSGTGSGMVITGNSEQTGAITRLVTGLSAGSHTFKLQWATTGGTANCRPATVGSTEHASIVVLELRV